MEHVKDNIWECASCHEKSEVSDLLATVRDAKNHMRKDSRCIAVIGKHKPKKEYSTEEIARWMR